MKKFFGVITILLLTGIFAFTTINFTDIFGQLGIKKAEATETIFFNFQDGTLNFPYSTVIRKLALNKRAEAVKEIEGMGCDVKSYELSDIKVTFLTSEAALITYKAAQDATCNGQAAPPVVWASSAYVKRGGKWFAASHQETPAKTN